jgi:hypothetical protein
VDVDELPRPKLMYMVSSLFKCFFSMEKDYKFDEMKAALSEIIDRVKVMKEQSWESDRN